VNNQNDSLNPQEVSETRELSEPAVEPLQKKPFVEPTVSVPVDVLEATTFFQGATVEASTI
jgi:hypothetical protein